MKQSSSFNYEQMINFVLCHNASAREMEACQTFVSYGMLFFILAKAGKARIIETLENYEIIERCPETWARKENE